MWPFKSKAEKELEQILSRMKCNLSNNYKDSAHEARRQLGRRVEELYAQKRISKRVYEKYRLLYEEYTQRLKDYHH